MKFAAFLLILVVCLFLDQAQAQCSNQPSNPVCTGRRGLGNTGAGCTSGERWTYDTGLLRCVSFTYNGCGGNNNRFCTREACRQLCGDNEK